MIIFKNDKELRQYLNDHRKMETSIGFIPTMGALHEGHIQLLIESQKICDISVVSIYVNPTQFNNKEDFKNYPVSTEADIDLLERNNCDILYLPSTDTIYPEQNNWEVDYEIGKLEHVLEGAFRPGHYKAVVQVVNILLQTVLPQHLFLGAKDYQQCAVLTDFASLHFPELTVTKVPTVRAMSGLALSSRNKRLSPTELERAPIIHTELLKIKENLSGDNLANLMDQAEENIRQYGLEPEYLVIANQNNLDPVLSWDGKTKIVALIAAHLGSVRLIDNLELN